MIKRIAHAAFTVSDMGKSLHFYCDVLGFKKAFELSDDDGKPWIVYVKVCDGQFIELFYSDGKDPGMNSKKIGYSHLCFEVDDIFENAKKMKSNGLKLDTEPMQGKDMNYQCWVRDPDGNRIEFMQMHPDAPQSK